MNMVKLRFHQTVTIYKQYQMPMYRDDEGSYVEKRRNMENKLLLNVCLKENKYER